MDSKLITKRLKLAIRDCRKIVNLLPQKCKPEICSVGLFYNSEAKEFVMCPSASKWSFEAYRPEDEIFHTYDFVTMLWVHDRIAIRPHTTLLTKLRTYNDSKGVFVNSLCKEYLLRNKK